MGEGQSLMNEHSLGHSFTKIPSMSYQSALPNLTYVLGGKLAFRRSGAQELLWSLPAILTSTWSFFLGENS